MRPDNGMIGVRALYGSNCCTGHEVWVLSDGSVVFRHHPELLGDIAPLSDLAQIRGDGTIPWCALVQQTLEGVHHGLPQHPPSQEQLRKAILRFLRGSAIAVPSAIRQASPAAARLLEWGKWHKGTTILVGGPMPQSNRVTRTRTGTRLRP